MDRPSDVRPDPVPGAGTVLVMAPVGRDAASAQALLAQLGIVTRAVSTLTELASAIDDSAGAVLITSEALLGRDLDELTRALDAQPAWSNLPFVCLAAPHASGTLRRAAAHRELAARVSNVLVLERPLSRETLMSAVNSALVARARQLSLRDQLLRIERSEQALRAADERREFIFELMKRHRSSDSPAAITQATAQALAARLGSVRVAFYRTPEVGAAFDLPAGALASELLAPQREPRPLRCDDTLAHPALAASPLPAHGVRALVAVPLLRSGRWEAGLVVHAAAPRGWSDDAVQLIDEVAQLTWDAVERADSEAALRESEARFRGVANSVDQIIWAARPDGWHDFFNERWYEFTGVSRQPGARWGHRVHGDDRDRVRAAWQHSLAGGAPYQTQYRLLHASGQYRWVLGRAQPVRDGAGRITRWFGSCTDIQDLVQAREVLARSRDQLEREVHARTQERDRIWQVSRDLLGVADLAGVWQSVNPAWTSVLGWAPGDVVGRSIEALLHPDDAAAVRAQLAALAAGAASPGFECRLRTAGGDWRTLSWAAAVQEGRLYCVARDVTEQHAQAEALRAAEDQLRQAQKMEAVGQLTGGIAHDFNNLLQGITGSLQALDKRLEKGDLTRADALVANALRSAERAAGLTHRLLAFSRRQPLAPTVVDVNPLITGMSELLQRTLGESARLELVLAPQLTPVRCDANQLESSLLNLAINARDAMGAHRGGGVLRILTSETGSGEVLQPALEPGRYVAIAVADNGAGMPGDVVQRAFDPFFTTKPQGQGTGLGLSMVYGFARQSRGDCRIASEPGVGTTVVLYLPCEAEAAAPPARPGVDAAPLHRLRGACVLLVEDDEVVRQVVGDALAEHGAQVRAAPDGAGGLALVAEAAAAAHLLVTDVGLPGVGGRQLAHAAREQRPGIGVLFMTGYAADAEQGHGFELDGRTGLVTKPFPIEHLLARASQLLPEPALV